MAATVIERATGVEYTAKAIEGGYEIYTASGEKYKKVKDSTFKRYFKLVKEEKAQKAAVEDSDWDDVEPDATETAENTEATENTEETEEVEKTKKAKTKAKAEKPKKDTATETEAHEELSPEKKGKMIEKIKKMLALAENNPSMEEGLQAALQAQKLMAKYNIHEDDVTLEEIKEEISSMFVAEVGKLVLMAWRKQLAVIVSKNFRCKCYMRGNAVAFRGYTQDVKIAVEVFKTLYAVGEKLGGKAAADNRKMYGTAKGVYNTFIAGFLRGIEEGFGEQCTALMIVTPKEVEEEYKEFSANFKPGKAKAITVTDAAIYNKGKVEGKAAVKVRQVEAKGE